MANYLRFLESCFLICFGAFMLVLANSSLYWQFMNPRYSWLTMAGGIVLVILGGATTYDRTRRPRLDELAGLGVFVATAVSAFCLPAPFADEPPTTFSAPAVQEEPASRFVQDGHEYVRANIAELLNLEGRENLQAGERFAMQGQVIRTPELDSAGYIVLNRLFVACCFADAVNVAYLVRVEQPAQFRMGDWVGVAGIVRPLAADSSGTSLPGMNHQDGDATRKGEQATPDATQGHISKDKAIPRQEGKAPSVFTVPGSVSSIISDAFMLEAESVEREEPSGLPFIFAIREKEPYSY